MDRQTMLAFVQRDWAAAARAKQQYWLDRYRMEGPGPAWRASALLLEHARRLGAVPTEADRDDDLRHQIELRDRLDRAGRALARR